jgi:hypothetical protein
MRWFALGFLCASTFRIGEASMVQVDVNLGWSNGPYLPTSGRTVVDSRPPGALTASIGDSESFLGNLVTGGARSILVPGSIPALGATAEVSVSEGASGSAGAGAEATDEILSTSGPLNDFLRYHFVLTGAIATPAQTGTYLGGGTVDVRVSALNTAYLDYSQNVGGVITQDLFANIPYTKGVPITVGWTLGVEAVCTFDSYSSPVGEKCHKTSEFISSLDLVGVQVVDVAGNPVDGVTLQSDSGVDYLNLGAPSTNVPEPATLVLTGIGLSFLVLADWRKRIRAL